MRNNRSNRVIDSAGFESTIGHLTIIIPSVIMSGVRRATDKGLCLSFFRHPRASSRYSGLHSPSQRCPTQPWRYYSGWDSIYHHGWSSVFSTEIRACFLSTSVARSVFSSFISQLIRGWKDPALTSGTISSGVGYLWFERRFRYPTHFFFYLLRSDFSWSAFRILAVSVSVAVQNSE